MNPIELQKGIIYGPVASRRLGRSLGVNLLPVTFKVCSLNCCYCQYGWTKTLVNDSGGNEQYMPTLKEVELGVRGAFKNAGKFDYITLCGNGEPTLHPGFPAIVELVRKIRDSEDTSVKIALLSNSTTCSKIYVREAIQQIDLPIMKLDVGNEMMFKQMNHGRPPVTFGKIVEGLKELSKYVIQTMFIKGAVDNSTDAEVKSWINALKELKPEWLQIYSLDRGTASDKLETVEPDRLNEIADLAKKETGLEVDVF